MGNRIPPIKWRPVKDPDEVKDYGLTWDLDGDTIETSEWEAPDGIDVDDESNTDTTTTIWLSGGTAGSVYLFTNRITTTGGRVLDRSARLVVKHK